MPPTIFGVRADSEEALRNPVVGRLGRNGVSAEVEGSEKRRRARAAVLIKTSGHRRLAEPAVCTDLKVSILETVAEVQ